MHWSVRCEGSKAIVQLRVTSPVLPQLPTTDVERRDSTDVLASADVDLSSTDEAAWPRLIAISASELIEQRQRGNATDSPRSLSPTPRSQVRVQLVNWAVKTNPAKLQSLFSVGATLARAGNPATTLVGANLGFDLHERSMLLAADVRGQWGKTSLRDANVSWQLISVALGAGAAVNCGPFTLEGLVGMRLGEVTLTGKATTPDASGRRLVGITGGPLIGLRVRTFVGQHVFVAVGFEEGYSLWPVRGTDDNVAPLASVDGAWSNGMFSVGWGL